MSSYLGAGAPGTALLVLARNVAVPVNTTAATAVYTAPQACQILYAIVRAGATAFGSTTSFALGTTGALSSLIATKVLTSLPTTVGAVVAVTAGATSTPFLAATNVVYWNAVQVDGGTATSAQLDLIGYIY